MHVFLRQARANVWVESLPKDFGHGRYRTMQNSWQICESQCVFITAYPKVLELVCIYIYIDIYMHKKQCIYSNKYIYMNIYIYIHIYIYIRNIIYIYIKHIYIYIYTYI